MIEDNLNLTEEELFIELGRQLHPRMANPLDPKELASRGMKWFEGKKNQIQAIVCKSEITKSIMKEEDNIKILTLIADGIAISILGNLPVSPFTIGAIVLKIGLKEFCSTE
jgi:hypothetical protein